MNVATALNVPPLYVNEPDVTVKVPGVKIPLVKLKSGPLTLTPLHVIVSANVGDPANNVTPAVVFPLYVNVPEPTMFKINEV